MDGWIEVAKVEDLAPGTGTVVDVVPPLAVWNIDGTFYCTDDTCTHAESSLVTGWLEGDVVECAFHWARFCVRDGRVVTPPANGPLRTHRVEIRDGVIFVQAPPVEDQGGHG